MFKSSGSDNRSGRAGGDRPDRPFEAARTSGQAHSTREADPADERRYWLVPTNLDAPEGDMERTQPGISRST
jgi:hypothetical protein